MPRGHSAGLLVVAGIIRTREERVAHADLKQPQQLNRMAQIIQRHVRRRVVVKKTLIQRAAFRQHNGVALRGIRVRQHGIPRLNAELRQCFSGSVASKRTPRVIWSYFSLTV